MYHTDVLSTVPVKENASMTWCPYFHLDLAAFYTCSICICCSLRAFYIYFLITNLFHVQLII